jgi:hypothetical protein
MKKISYRISAMIPFDPEMSCRYFNERFFISECRNAISRNSNDSLNDSLAWIFRTYQTYNFSSVYFEVAGFVLE